MQANLEEETSKTQSTTTDVTARIQQSLIALNAYVATVPDLWAFGITVVIGGQYFGWNGSLIMGFGSFNIALTLISFAYLTLCLSLSELTSFVPFGGKISPYSA